MPNLSSLILSLFDTRSEMMVGWLNSVDLVERMDSQSCSGLKVILYGVYPIISSSVGNSGSFSPCSSPS